MITEQIIKKAQQGDSDAFTQIYNETIRTAYFVAKRILLDERAVEEVLQDSYIKVYKNLGKYKAGNFQGWVDTIVANTAKNYKRITENSILFSQMETEENIPIEFEEEKIAFRPDAKVDYDETKRLVMNIVDGLSADQRLTVLLYYFEQRSVKEIAEICECSENTVKSRLNYARKNIKEEVLVLEKKGTKLYSISVLPFLYWLFKEEVRACEVPASTKANVANAAGKAIERTTGKPNPLEKAGRNTAEGVSKVTKTVAETVAAETVKTGMALGTKIAIGAVIATLAVGGVALGSTVWKDHTPVTEQDSEEDSQQDTETEQESEQETEQSAELSREEIDQIVNDFLVSYQPAEQIEKFGFTFHPKDDPYGKTYFYTWCNDIPIVAVRTFYVDENGQTEGMSNKVFYYVDKSTGEILEIPSPACMVAPDLEYLFYVGKTDIIIRESFWGEEPFTFYRESFSTDGFGESMISEAEAESLLGRGDYQQMEWSYIADLTANTGVNEAAISQFVRNYVPDSTYNVFELKDYPLVTKYYKEHIGVQYVSFATGETTLLVVSTPYGAEDSDMNIFYKLQIYYYDETAKTFVLFENQPDISCDAEGYPTSYNFNVYAQNDGISNEFKLYDGYTYIQIDVAGTTLNWRSSSLSALGGTPLPWKK